MAAPSDLLHACSIRDFLKPFKSITAKPESFLGPQPSKIEDLRNLTKTLYDCQKHFENNSSEYYLPELIVDQFDDEQIWQELELKNKVVISRFLQDITKTLARKDFNSPTTKANIEPTINDADASNEENDEDQDDSDSNESFKVKPPKRVTFKKSNAFNSEKASIVDDKFFKLSQLEEFLIVEDRKEFSEKKKLANADDNDDDEEDDDSGSVDLFEDMLSSEDDDEMMESEEDENQTENKQKGKRASYEDFFDPPESNVPAASESLDGSEDENEEAVDDLEFDTRDVSADELDQDNSNFKLDEDNLGWNDEGEDVDDVIGTGRDKRVDKPNLKSNFDKEQQQLKRKINELEEMNLSEKPWQLKGEIAAEGRPENSLLEEHLQFDHMVRQAPVITEETTKQLEDIILQRIKDKVWDDVERKNKPKEEAFEYRRRVVLDQEKSKQSLAEIYEKEYIKQQTKEKEDKEVPEHSTIKEMMTDLFAKLEALSNFHYTPKPSRPEIKVISNIPAITVEEVAPVHISEAVLLAPEEVKDKERTEVKGSTEKSETDRKRERRKKKKRQGIKHRLEESRDKTSQKGKGTKESKKGKNAALKSSTSFFSTLQDQMNSAKTTLPIVKKKKNASKLKL